MPASTICRSRPRTGNSTGIAAVRVPRIIRACPISVSEHRFREPFSVCAVQCEGQRPGRFGPMHGTIIQHMPGSAAHQEERPSREEAEAAVRTLLRWAGDTPMREGLAGTPARVVRAYEEWFEGYSQDPAALLQRTFE